MVAEMHEIGVEDHGVVFVVRRFKTVCPKCGPVMYDITGHHGTISKMELRKEFSPLEQKRLRRVLPKEEARIFQRTMDGLRMPKDGELECWRARLVEIPSSPWAAC
jgi:hypothetical protein